MSIDGSSDVPPFCAADGQGYSRDGNSPLRPRQCQNAKIWEIKDALFAAGVLTLDRQAEALGLSRSTAWHLLSGKHKGSGISASIINRMLAAPRLPPAVRVTILEYVAEKVAGRYGDSKLRLNKFTARLPRAVLDDPRTVGANPRKRSAPLRLVNPGTAAARKDRASRS